MMRRVHFFHGSRIPLGGVARNLVVVGGATMVGQGALLVAAPVLSRLYDPQAFGLLSVYAAALSVLVAVASLRFDLAIPIADDAVEAFHLLGLSVLLAAGASVVMALVVLVWGTELAAVLGAASLAPFLWFIPIALFVASVAQALSSWAVYHRLFPALGRLRATQGGAQAASQVALGVLHAGPLGLIVGDLAGRALGTEQLLRSLIASLRTTERSLGALRQYARARWSFARVMTAASLLSALSLQVPFLMIPTVFGLESSGQYFLAYRLLVLPGSLVAAAVSQVFFGEASFRRADPERLHDLAYNAAVSLFVISIPTYTIIAIGGPVLIDAVFGSQWDAAGIYAQISAPSLLIWSVASPISTLLLVGQRQLESLAFTAVGLVLEAGSIVIGAMVHSLLVGIAILSAVSVLTNGAALWRFLRVASVRLQHLGRPTGRIFALTMPSIVVLVLVRAMAPAATLPAAAIGWLVAVGLAARLSPEVRALVSGSHD